MFLGEYQIKFSGKGRLVLPSKIRDQIEGKIIILSRGFEGCIFGYSPQGFEIESKRQLEISATEERARYLRRYLFSASSEVVLDSQSRFVIPSSLLSYAKLIDEIKVIGSGDHFEIWNSNLWEKHLKVIERDYGRVS